jgi:hypothetical protein
MGKLGHDSWALLTLDLIVLAACSHTSPTPARAFLAAQGIQALLTMFRKLSLCTTEKGCSVSIMNMMTLKNAARADPKAAPILLFLSITFALANEAEAAPALDFFGAPCLSWT